MKKLFILFLFITLFLQTVFAYNVREDSMGRPLYAADRIKVKLSEVAADRLNSVLTEEGDYSDTGLDRLDNLFESISVSKIKLAHRPLLDKVWEQENGFNRWYLLFVPIGTDIENTITDISINEYIEHANPEFISYYTVTPNDTFFDECWGHDNTSTNGPGSGHVVGFDSHIEEAWDGSQGYGDSSIIIAIIDSGVDYDHEDLDGNCVAGYDYGSGDSDPMDEYRHGTSCAGVAAAEVNNLIGVSGVAGNCSIMPLKISIGSGAPLATAGNNAITHCADNNVDIASMSWGGGSDYGDDPARDDALQYAYDNGVTLLAATGNDNISSINNPANDPNVIAVGAASPCAERKDTSSCDGSTTWGSQYGVNTEGARNAVDVMGPTILPATDITGTSGYSTGDYTMTFGGTSCATPYVAGVAALIKSKNPSFTPAQIKGLLTSTATDIIDEGPAGWDRYTGYGMVNAGAALGPNIWTGDLNEYWGNNTNWSLGHVPTASEDVVIPNVIEPCVVDFSDKECLNLTIEAGAVVEIVDQSLTVHNDLDVHGDLTLTDTASRCYVNHDIRWHNGSTGNMTGSATIDVKEDWNFNSGANVQFTAGYVDFSGTATTWLRSYEENCEIYRLRSDKSGGAYLNISDLSTEDLHITGNIYNYAASNFRSSSHHNVFIGGFLNNLGGNIYGMNGTFVFDGNPSTVALKPNVGNYFNNLTFSGSGTLSLDNTYSSDLQINGNLELAGGTLAGNTFNITVGGNWTNSGGTFTPGTSMVTFDSGGDPQDVDGTNTFYDVQQVNTGNYLRFNGNTTIHDLELNYFSWAYSIFNVTGTLNIDNPNSKFTANGSPAIATIATLDQGGTIFCNGAATITINDLVESTIQGTYYANDIGGTINLSNGGAAVDLQADLYINGGTMNIAGSYCYWPFGGDASITMTDGVLDVTDCGIYLASSYELTETITGGIIRTAYGFTGVRPDFNPTGGEIELYGTTDAYLSMGLGSNFYDVRINKAAAEYVVTKLSGTETNDSEIIDSRKEISELVVESESRRTEIDRNINTVELTRSNTVYVNTSLAINGDLYIDAGTFYLADFGVDVRDDLFHYGNLNVSGFLYIGDDCYYYSGSNVDLTGNIENGTYSGRHGSSYHYSGSTFNQTDGYYYVESIQLYNGCQYNGSAKEVHIYVNGYSLDNTIQIDDPDSYFYKFFVDIGANASLYSCDYDLDVTHTANIYAPLDINGFTMNALYMNVYDAGDLIINTNGVVNITGDGPYMHSAGALTMTAGSELNSANHIRFYTGSTENVSDGDIYLEGSLTNSSGIFTPTGGSVTFDGNTASSIIGATAFHDLNINKTGSVVTSNAAFSMNDLVINSGILNPSGYNIEVYGDWTNNVGNAGFTEGTQTVTFIGPNDGDILTEETFYNLTVDKSNANFTALEAFQNVTVANLMHIVDGVYEMNASSNLILGNDVIIELGAGLNANDAPLNIYVGGNWTNFNTDYGILNGFWHGYISTVIFNNAGNNILTTSAPQEDFYNLTVYKAADQFRSNDNIQVFGNLLLFDGEWNDNVSGLTHTFHGDFEVTSDAAWFTHINANTVVFAGENDQEFIYNHYGVGYFRDVIIDKSPVDYAIMNGPDQPAINNDREVTESRAQTVTMYTNMDIQLGGTLTIDEGTMQVNGNTLRGDGNITVNGGTLALNSNSTLWLDDGAELSVNGGLLETIGTPGNMAHITHRNTGYYGFEVENGGTISAEYTTFEYMNSNGLWIKGDGFADPVHTFHYCTFQNGTAGYAPLLVINNDQILTCNGVNFPQTGVSDFNAAKAYNGGEMDMVGATGSFAGEAYEFDTYDRITWGGLPEIDDLTIQYSAGNIILNWTYSETFDHFKVYRSTDPYDFSGATIFTTPTVGYSEPATGTNYFYQVTADNTPADGGSRGKTESSDSAPWGK